MRIVPTPLNDAVLIEPKVFGDKRGFFMESWNAATFSSAGLELSFVQDNHSRSSRGVLRGLHLQNPKPQGKLVRVVNGAVWDAIVDLRVSSSTFGRWYGVELSAENHRMLWVPPGFAHGFLTLADDTDFLYKCTAPYEPNHEHSLRWDDPTIGVDWPLADLSPIISEKDNAASSFSEVAVFP